MYFGKALTSPGGLDLLEIKDKSLPSPENWLDLEAELRKLSLAIEQKQKVATLFSKRKIFLFLNSYIWPDELDKELGSILDAHLGRKEVHQAVQTLKQFYFETLPTPGYWEYEELDCQLKACSFNVKEKEWRSYYGKLMAFVDNYQWPTKIRYELEDLQGVSLSSEILQKIKSVQKIAKNNQPLPQF